MSLKSLKRLSLDGLSRLVCVSISTQKDDRNETVNEVLFSSNANRKRRRSADEGQTKAHKKMKIATDDEVFVFSYHKESPSSYARDFSGENLNSRNAENLRQLTNVRDVSICLKKYLSILPDKMWTELYHKVIQDIKSDLNTTTSSVVTPEPGSDSKYDNRSKILQIERVSEVFVCPKLIEFDTRELESLSPSEKMVALRRIKYCSKLQQLIADSVPAAIKFPRDIFRHLHQLRRVHLTGAPEKLCFYWALKPIAMYCKNITHLKIAYNPDSHCDSGEDESFCVTEYTSKRLSPNDTGMSLKISPESFDEVDLSFADENKTDRKRPQNFLDGNLHLESETSRTKSDHSVGCLRRCQLLKSLFLFNFGRKCESSEIKTLILSLNHLEFIYHKELVNAITDIHEEHMSSELRTDTTQSIADTPRLVSQNLYTVPANLNTITAASTNSQNTTSFSSNSHNTTPFSSNSHNTTSFSGNFQNTTFFSSNSHNTTPFSSTSHTSTAVSRSGRFGNSRNSRDPVARLPLRALSLRVWLPHYGEQRVYASREQLVRVACWCPHVTELTLVAPPALHRVLGALRLTALTIIQSPCDPALSDALHSAPAQHLTKLRLSEVLLTHADFASIAASCPALEVLSVHYCGLLNDFTSLNAGNNFNFNVGFPNAKEIDISEPDALQPWCFGARLAKFLLRGSNKIAKLKLEFENSDLDPRDDVEGEVLVSVLGNKCELEFLEFISPPFLSPDCVKSLLSVCPKLTHVGKRSTWPFGYELSYNIPPQIDFI